MPCRSAAITISRAYGRDEEAPAAGRPSESATRPSAVTHSPTTCRCPGARPSGRISTPSASAAAGTRTRPTTAPTTKATAGCRSSRELSAAALATVLQGLHRKQESAAGVLIVPFHRPPHPALISTARADDSGIRAAQQVRQLPGVCNRVIAVAVVYPRLGAVLTCVFAGRPGACRRSYRNITRPFWHAAVGVQVAVVLSRPATPLQWQTPGHAGTRGGPDAGASTASAARSGSRMVCLTAGFGRFRLAGLCQPAADPKGVLKEGVGRRPTDHQQGHRADRRPR
jgi:hypothetical protein